MNSRIVSGPASDAKILVWSASPTPFLECGALDLPGVVKTVNRHVQLRCDGIMLAGTCGEGPWISDSDNEKLVRTGLDAAQGRISISVQATDNSSARILERIERLAAWGASAAVVAQPYFLVNATAGRLLSLYTEVFECSPLPVVFYDRGKHAAVPVPNEILGDILSHARVVMEKDSSCDPVRWTIAQKVRSQRADLRLLNGDEFQLIRSLQAGFDGAFFGGAILTGHALRICAQRFKDGDPSAPSLDEEIREMLWTVYGRDLSSWLAGLKYALVRLGTFSSSRNILGFPLSAACKAAIDAMIERNPHWLSPT